MFLQDTLNEAKTMTTLQTRNLSSKVDWLIWFIVYFESIQTHSSDKGGNQGKFWYPSHPWNKQTSVYFEWFLIKHTVFLLLVFSQDTWNKAKTMATLQTRDLVYDQPKAHLCSIPLHGWPIPRHRVWSQRNCRWGPQVGQGQNWPQRFRTR